MGWQPICSREEDRCLVGDEISEARAGGRGGGGG